MLTNSKRAFSTQNLLLLAAAFLVYSSESIFIKLASNEETMSVSFIMYYGLAICVLGVYAVLWQFVLKRIPLSIAFMCKSITLIIILLIAHVLFGESITLSNTLGSGIILSGIILLAWEK
jgi:drug/metabolite transporter (DMT)-like permease